MKQVAAMAEEDQLSPFNLERLLHAEEMRIMASMKERGVESTIGLDTVEVEALQGATFGVGDVGTTTEQKDEEYANRLIQAEVLSGGTENVAQETAQVQLHSSGTIITRMAELAKAALEHIGLPVQIRLVDEAGIAAVLAKVDTELAALQQTLMRVAASPETAEKTARISSLISRRGALEAFREQLISQAQSKEPGWIMFSNSEWVDLRTPVVFLSDKITGSLEKARVLAHELGHLITHEVLDQFPDIKAAIAKELQASASPLETEENLAKQFERYLVKAATTLPDSAVQKVRVPRFLCLNCRKTFSCLPFCLVRRLGISLSDLIQCAASTEPWAALEETLMIARSTLWRWRRIGKKLLALMPELLALAGNSWLEASHMISRIQYPPALIKPHPTQAGN